MPVGGTNVKNVSISGTLFDIVNSEE